MNIFGCPRSWRMTSLWYFMKLSLETGRGQACPQTTSAVPPVQPPLAVEETGRFWSLSLTRLAVVLLCMGLSWSCLLSRTGSPVAPSQPARVSSDAPIPSHQ